jgi:hypothetical protein
MEDGKSAVLLSHEEIKILFKRLKPLEPALDAGERDILGRMEESLYDCLSVDEVEKLLPAGARVSAGGWAFVSGRGR